MSDKSKYTIFEIIIPGYVYIKPNVNVLFETVHEIWKSYGKASFLFLLF